LEEERDTMSDKKTQAELDQMRSIDVSGINRLYIGLPEGLEELLKETEGHEFDYKQLDTGLTFCRHPSHYIHALHCWRAEVNKFLKEKQR
jgi:hypothetical protein